MKSIKMNYENCKFATQFQFAQPQNTSIFLNITLLLILVTVTSVTLPSILKHHDVEMKEGDIWLEGMGTSALHYEDMTLGLVKSYR